MRPLPLLLILPVLACTPDPRETGAPDPGDTDTSPPPDSADTGAPSDTGWWVDLDGDGASPAEGDCDDANPDRSPAATETCNGVDDDCDGTTDGPDAVDAGTWYPDADGDGHGDPAAPIRACDAPTGALPTGDDCDDTNAEVHPGASDTCDDGVDQDCSGADRSCGITGEWPADRADIALLGGADYGYAGWSLATGDLGGDGLPDLAVGAPGDDGGVEQGGTVFVFPAAPLISGLLDAAPARLQGDTPRTLLGTALEVADTDADGLGEILVGTGSGRGPYLFDGPFAGTLTPTDAVAVLGSEESWVQSLTPVADPGAGGVGALLGLPYGSGGPDAPGRAVLLEGPLRGERALDEAVLDVTGSVARDGFGQAVTAGDFDADGLPDPVVGTWLFAAGSPVAWIFDGATRGSLATDAAEASLLSELPSSVSGQALHAADVDLDGYDDLWIGIWSARVGDVDRAGAAWLVRGPISSGSLADAHAKRTGVIEADGAGLSLDTGDVDGDGWPDLLAGATRWDGEPAESGRAYLVSGPVSGAADFSTAEATFEEEFPGDLLGCSVSLADLDGSGYADALIGAPGSSDGGSLGGAAYVFHASRW